MEAFFIGLFLILVGLAFTFAGYQFARVLIPLWGFIAGFFWGADVISASMGGGFLATGFSWIFGLVTGLIIGALAYYFYVLEVAILFGFIGYWLVEGLFAALGLPTGFFVTFTATVVGIVLAVIAVYMRAPKGLLVFFTAFGGALFAIGGLLLMFGQIPLALLGTGFVSAVVQQSWFWSLSLIVLGIIGIVSQLSIPDAIENYEESSYSYPTHISTAGTKGGKSSSKNDKDNDAKKSN